MLRFISYRRAHTESVRLRPFRIVAYAALIGVLSSATVNLGALSGLRVQSALASSTYRTTVLTDNPSVYYRFDESSGTTAHDSTSNGLDATYQSSVTLGTGSALTGDSDTSINISGGNGNGAATRAETGIPTGSSARTAEIWFQSTSNSYLPLFYWGQTGAPTSQFFLYVTNGNELFLSSYSYGVGGYAPYSLNDGSWHYAAATYDGNTTMTLYVDGLQVGRGSIPTTLNTVSTASLLIGGDGSNAFSGYLDEAAIYPSALTASALNKHWLAGRAVASGCGAQPTTGYGAAVLADSPVEYMRLGEASGVAALDATASCRAGAYTNGVNHGGGPLVNEGGHSVTAPSTTADGASISSELVPVGQAARSVELWENTTQSGIIPLLYYGDTTGTVSQFYVYLHDSTTVYLSSYSYAVTATSSRSLEDGNWHQIVVTYDGNLSVHIYADGAQIGSGNLGAALNTKSDSAVIVDGCNCGNPPYGSVSEVSIYSSVLASSRAKAHYMASGHTTPISSPVTATAAPTGAPACQTCATASFTVGQMTKFPINTESGNFYHSFADISIPGRSYPLALTRTYN